MNDCIHIQNFPKDRVFVLLKNGFREDFFDFVISFAANWDGQGPAAGKLAKWLQKKSPNKRKTSFQNVYDWREGKTRVRKELREKYSKKIRRFTPLWVVLEIAELLSEEHLIALRFINPIKKETNARIRFGEKKQKRLMRLLTNLFYNKLEKASDAVGIPKPTFKGYLYHKRKTIPFETFQKIVLVIEQRLAVLFNLIKNLEQNVWAYRAEAGGIVWNPILPIPVNPVFDSIVIHLFGDGYGGRYGRTGHTPFYAQKNALGKGAFLAKVVSTFGRFKVNKIAYKKNEVYFPIVIVHVIQDYYKLKSFKSSKARIPKQMKEKTKEFKLAMLAAIIVDDGHVVKRRATIVITSKNVPMLKDFKEIASSLGYQMSKITTTETASNFRIYAESSREFARDIRWLIKKWPLCGLAQKQARLMSYIN